MKKIDFINENSLMITFATDASPEITRMIAAYKEAIQLAFSIWITDIIPSYTSILISVDIKRIGLNDFALKVTSLLKKPLTDFAIKEKDHIILPVYYDESIALDAEALCLFSGLSFDEIVTCHSNPIYHVYAIGFRPGFAYLGNVDEKIAIPRKKTPRAYVPQGSVAIADQQTAIYPKASPGGWHIIGLCPIPLLDFNKPNLCIFSVGASVKFEAITKKEFIALGGCLSSIQNKI